jgi:hypothetical protein
VNLMLIQSESSSHSDQRTVLRDIPDLQIPNFDYYLFLTAYFTILLSTSSFTWLAGIAYAK